MTLRRCRRTMMMQWSTEVIPLKVEISLPFPSLFFLLSIFFLFVSLCHTFFCTTFICPLFVGPPLYLGRHNFIKRVSPCSLRFIAPRGEVTHFSHHDICRFEANSMARLMRCQIVMSV